MEYIPLLLIKRGTKAVIKMLLSDIRLRRRLLCIGIIPEVEVSVVFQSVQKGVVLEMGNFRVALNRYVAKQVLAVPL